MSAIRICSFLWMGFCVIWLLAGVVTKQVHERTDVASRLLYGAPVILGFYLLFSGRLPLSWLDLRLFSQSELIGILGVSFTALGIAFAIWARLHIGQNWSSTPTVKVGHELIRTGPYAWVRHPIYSGLLIAACGTAIAQARLRGILAIAFVWIGFTIKSRIEESMMAKTFGEAYESYSQSTGALLPKFRS